MTANAAVPLGSVPFKEPRMTTRQVRRWIGRPPVPPPEPPEPPGAALAVVQVQGTTWTIRRGEGYGHGWFDLIVERGAPSPDRATRRSVGHRRRWRLRWKEAKWRFAETPEARTMAFRAPHLYLAITDLMIRRSF